MTDKFLESNLFVFFRFKSYLFKRLFRPMLYITIPTTILCILYEFKIFTFGNSVTLPGLLGAALGILLVFRNNSAYDRWWEARKVLGGLVNNSRNFALQVNQFVPNLKDKKEFMALIASFPYALKEHLRDGVLLSEIAFIGEKNISILKGCDHKPNALANLMSAKIHTLYQEGTLSDFQRIKLIDYVDLNIDILGKCERIRKTPIPAAHNYLLKFFIFIYTISLPFGFVGILHYWSIFAVAAIYFLAMSIVTIAEEIEEPFGKDPNDLPVDAIAQGIHKNVYEIQNTTLVKLKAATTDNPKCLAES
ncbi:MAG: bestrophin family protein [Flammeovirgaceae bacterium]